MNKTKSLQIQLSAQSLVDTYRVTNCRSEVLLRKCLLNDNTKKQYKVWMHTHVRWSCTFCIMHHKEWVLLFFWRRTEPLIDARTHISRTRTIGLSHYVLTTRTHVDAETKHSNTPTLANLFTVASLDCSRYALFQYFAKFLQWCVPKYSSFMHTSF